MGKILLDNDTQCLLPDGNEDVLLLALLLLKSISDFPFFEQVAPATSNNNNSNVNAYFILNEMEKSKAKMKNLSNGEIDEKDKDIAFYTTFKEGKDIIRTMSKNT